MAAGHRKQSEAAPAQQLPSSCHRPLSSGADRLCGTLQLGLSTPQGPPGAPPAPEAGSPPSPPALGMAWHSTEGSSPAGSEKEPARTRSSRIYSSRGCRTTAVGWLSLKSGYSCLSATRRSKLCSSPA